MRWIKIVLLLIVILNAGLLFGSVGSQFVTANEVRCLPGGLAVWKSGSFALANDFPPLAKMAASLPALFMRVNFYIYDLSETGIVFESSLRDREEEFGAHFAYANPARYMSLIGWARTINDFWWLLGAWLIARWANELYGATAVVLALVLWGLGPNILAREQQATPALASAVALVVAMAAIRRSFEAACWGRALAAGIVLGVTQFVDFTSLMVYALWPIMAIVRWRQPDGRTFSTAQVLGMVGRAASILLLSVWVLNLGYGFQGSGTALEDYAFVSRALGADDHSSSPPTGGEPTGNRFRGTWLGRVPVPLPSDYLDGLDRRWHERETATGAGSDGESLATRAENPLTRLGAKVPLGVWILAAWSLVSTVARNPGGVRWRDEMSVWLPVVAILVLSTDRVGVLSPSHASILIAPFGAAIASKLASYLQPGHWKRGWLVLALVLWSTGSGLASYPNPCADLNEAVGERNGVAARLRHGPFDGGPISWLSRIGWEGIRRFGSEGWSSAIRSAPGSRACGIHFLRPIRDQRSLAIPPTRGGSARIRVITRWISII